MMFMATVAVVRWIQDQHWRPHFPMSSRRGLERISPHPWERGTGEGTDINAAWRAQALAVVRRNSSRWGAVCADRSRRLRGGARFRNSIYRQTIGATSPLG